MPIFDCGLGRSMPPIHLGNLTRADECPAAFKCFENGDEAVDGVRLATPALAHRLRELRSLVVGFEAAPITEPAYTSRTNVGSVAHCGNTNHISIALKPLSALIPGLGTAPYYIEIIEPAAEPEMRLGRLYSDEGQHVVVFETVDEAIEMTRHVIGHRHPVPAPFNTVRGADALETYAGVSFYFGRLRHHDEVEAFRRAAGFAPLLNDTPLKVPASFKMKAWPRRLPRSVWEEPIDLAQEADDAA
jgi:hypothetical protein